MLFSSGWRWGASGFTWPVGPEAFPSLKQQRVLGYARSFHPSREEQNMPTFDIVGPGYVFYPLMLMLFSFAVVVEGPGEAWVRLVIWLVAFVIVCGVPFVVAYKLGHLEFE
jgi:hypothetical protein